MSQVLVTGAGGFIGSHLVELLLANGHSVRAMVRYNSRNDWGMLESLSEQVRSDIEVVTGDLRDPVTVGRAVAGCQYVFHLGALIAIPYSYLSPDDVMQTNVWGTLNVLNACRNNDALERVVHTSTSEVYGTAQYTPMDEKHPLQAQSPYAASKIAADKIAESFHLSYELPVVTLRPFNAFGPRQSARAIIPTIFSQVLMGETVRLGNISTRRDFTFVKDTARAFLMASQTDKAEGLVLNAGTGRDVSIEVLFNMICEIAKKEAKIEVDAQRVRKKGSEVEVLQCNSDLALQVMGWQPEYTLEAGLAEVYDWIQDHIDTIKYAQYNV